MDRARRSEHYEIESKLGCLGFKFKLKFKFYLFEYFIRILSSYNCVQLLVAIKYTLGGDDWRIGRLEDRV